MPPNSLDCQFLSYISNPTPCFSINIIIALYISPTHHLSVRKHKIGQCRQQIIDIKVLL